MLYSEVKIKWLEKIEPVKGGWKSWAFLLWSICNCILFGLVHFGTVPEAEIWGNVSLFMMIMEIAKEWIMVPFSLIGLICTFVVFSVHRVSKDKKAALDYMATLSALRPLHKGMSFFCLFGMAFRVAAIVLLILAGWIWTSIFFLLPFLANYFHLRLTFKMAGKWLSELPDTELKKIVNPTAELEKHVLEWN
jgi:hypothetical protein